MVQTDEVVTPYVTVSPEVAVADAMYVAPPTVAELGAVDVNDTVCEI
jgi:hypothetical protein